MSQPLNPAYELENRGARAEHNRGFGDVIWRTTKYRQFDDMMMRVCNKHHADTYTDRHILLTASLSPSDPQRCLQWYPGIRGT